MDNTYNILHKDVVGEQLRHNFLHDMGSLNLDELTTCIVLVQTPNGLESITALTGKKQKIEYYLSAYDSAFHLKTNNAVRIVGYLIN